MRNWGLEKHGLNSSRSPVKTSTFEEISILQAPSSTIPILCPKQQKKLYNQKTQNFSYKSTVGLVLLRIEHSEEWRTIARNVWNIVIDAVLNRYIY